VVAWTWMDAFCWDTESSVRLWSAMYRVRAESHRHWDSVQSSKRTSDAMCDFKWIVSYDVLKLLKPTSETPHAIQILFRALPLDVAVVFQRSPHKLVRMRFFGAVPSLVRIWFGIDWTVLKRLEYCNPCFASLSVVHCARVTCWEKNNVFREIISSFRAADQLGSSTLSKLYCIACSFTERCVL